LLSIMSCSMNEIVMQEVLHKTYFQASVIRFTTSL